MDGLCCILGIKLIVIAKFFFLGKKNRYPPLSTMDRSGVHESHPSRGAQDCSWLLKEIVSSSNGVVTGDSIGRKEKDEGGRGKRE